MSYSFPPLLQNDQLPIGRLFSSELVHPFWWPSSSWGLQSRQWVSWIQSCTGPAGVDSSRLDLELADNTLCPDSVVAGPLGLRPLLEAMVVAFGECVTFFATLRFLCYAVEVGLTLVHGPVENNLPPLFSQGGRWRFILIF